MNLGAFVIFKGKNGQYYFNLKASSGAVILQSEGYTTKQGCLSGINSVKSNALDFNQYARRTSRDERYYFVLKAKNGEVIGVSELYSSQGAREHGINQVSESTELDVQDNSS
jgi:uncharacterized protein YegP (UPF0339 family)